MNPLRQKLRLLYWPFIMILVGFTAIYSLFHYVLLQMDWSFFKEEVVAFWLPLALPVLPVYFWLKPRVKYLRFKQANGAFIGGIVAVVAIAAPCMIAQDYLVTRTGKLTQLESISQLKNHPPTKYYALQNAFVYRDGVKVHSIAAYTDKNRKITFTLFVAMPILDAAADTSGRLTGCWLGRKYTHAVDGGLGQKEQDEAYDQFARQSQAAFDSTDFRQFTYLEKLGNTDDRDNYIKAIGQSEPGQAQKTRIFVSRTSTFEARGNGSFPWIFFSAAIGCLIVFVFLLIIPYQPPAEKVLETQPVETINPETSVPEATDPETTEPEITHTATPRPPTTPPAAKESANKQLLTMLTPRAHYTVTPILMIINIVLFIAMVIAGLGFLGFEGNDLITWGGIFYPAIKEEGQYWRLITGAFLHAGILHLVFNMSALAYIGAWLEPALGTVKYLVAYLLTAIAGSIAGVWWHPDGVGVGASGAIFGLEGLLLALLLFKVFPPHLNKAFLSSTMGFLAYNLFLGWAIPFINNAAHIGGLVAGFLIGIVLAGSVKKRLTHLQEEQDIQ